MPSTGDSPLPAPHPAVVYQALEEGGVLFSTEGEVYYGLNRVGAQVWELLTVASSLAELCAELERMHPETPLSTLNADVADLLDRLQDARLLVAPDLPPRPDADG